MAMSTQPGDALIPVQTVKVLPAILEEKLLLSCMASRGRRASRRMVTAAADQIIPYYMPGRKNMLPYNGWMPTRALC